MFNITDATIDDLPEMMKHAEVFVKFYGMEWHKPSVKALLVKLINNGVVKLARKDGVFVGSIGGIVLSNPWNTPQKVLQEMFWWVAEEYRGSSAGLRLLHAFEGSFDGPKVMNLLPQTPVKKDMLAKLGYSLKEYSFVKE
jgi:hypothetical protein